VSAEDILEDQNVAAHSRDFAAKVLGDDNLQREGGHAIWNSVSHALKPGVQRVTGFWLVVVCVGVARVLLSPF